MRVFLGITGASGAPYARRLLAALAAADCEVGVCVSGAAIEVLATELYGDARLSRDEVLARFVEGTGEPQAPPDRTGDAVQHATALLAEGLTRKEVARQIGRAHV